MEGRVVFAGASGGNRGIVVCAASQITIAKGFPISDLEQSEDDREERIRDIDRRLSELDELLAKYIDSTMLYAIQAVAAPNLALIIAMLASRTPTDGITIM